MKKNHGDFRGNLTPHASKRLKKAKRAKAKRANTWLKAKAASDHKQQPKNISHAN